MSAQLSVTVMVSREDDRFVAQCLEVDVSSFGDTQEEALATVIEALELWFEATRAAWSRSVNPFFSPLRPRCTRVRKNNR